MLQLVMFLMWLVLLAARPTRCFESQAPPADSTTALLSAVSNVQLCIALHHLLCGCMWEACSALCVCVGSMQCSHGLCGFMWEVCSRALHRLGTASLAVWG